LNISICYENGSIGNINYFANGSKAISKEYIEVYQAGMTATLKDFRELSIYGAGKPIRKKLFTQDKGQRNEVRLFIETVKTSNCPLIPYEQIFNASLVSFKVLESLQTGRVIHL